MNMKLPTYEQVAQLLEYDSITGIIKWKVNRRRAHAGQEAGCDGHDGYRYIGLFGRLYLAHRVAWLLHYGAWPEGCLDHKDRDGSNNSIDNLRIATSYQNARNRKKHFGCTSRFKGVSRCPNGKWQVHLGGNNVGTFSSEVQAAFAYDAAARHYHGEFASPNFPEGESL